MDVERFMQDLDFSSVDLWNDAQASNFGGTSISQLNAENIPCLAEADCWQLIEYLTKSRAFVPSDSWKPLLDKALMDVRVRAGAMDTS